MHSTHTLNVLPALYRWKVEGNFGKSENGINRHYSTLIHSPYCVLLSVYWVLWLGFCILTVSNNIYFIYAPYVKLTIPYTYNIHTWCNIEHIIRCVCEYINEYNMQFIRFYFEWIYAMAAVNDSVLRLDEVRCGIDF